MKERLFSLKHKRITVDGMMQLAGPMEYEDFAALVYQYVEENILAPVKSAGKNGRRPSLYNKYWIVKPESDYSTALEEIKLLHPWFDHSKYAKHPEMYVRYKREIDLISNFLWENADRLKEPMSMNERSFQIWGMEKLLKDKSIIKSIFNYNDWHLSLLNFYETPEPFFEYIFSNENEMNILIVENKDTWFSLRKIMRENKLNQLFRNYQVLLYGEGKKITSRNRLKEYDNLLTGSINRYYYFGDLDYEGIEIYQTVLENNKELDINLCAALYSWMLVEAKEYSLPRTKLGQKKVDINAFVKSFTVQESEEIKAILDNGLYIPQEILNYPLLKGKMMEGLKR
ncbi:DUF2220 family protein [Metallumcola ferriviriculae]|uniref:DUF2220 family protein n=1 Tax=Metallumcola ferriviriculae TaxID=3039180 RepID=A0AAU0UTU7_9FIRM|nr:DUF2220 family protein [Desulfitibacteraceae bacterium MK1]